MEALKQELYNRLRSLRALEHLIELDFFDVSFDACSKEEQKRIRELFKIALDESIDERDSAIDTIRSMLRLKSSGESIRDLRAAAKKFGIKNWSRMRKYDLEFHIKRIRNANPNLA